MQIFFQLQDEPPFISRDADWPILPLATRDQALDDVSRVSLAVPPADGRRLHAPNLNSARADKVIPCLRRKHHGLARGNGGVNMEHGAFTESGLVRFGSIVY